MCKNDKTTPKNTARKEEKKKRTTTAVHIRTNNTSNPEKITLKGKKRIKVQFSTRNC